MGMGDKRSVTQLLAPRNSDATRSAANSVTSASVDELFEHNDRKHLESLFRKLNCSDMDSAFREVALTAKWAALAKDHVPLSATEAIDFAKTIESATANLTRLLQSEIQNDWLVLEEYMAGFDNQTVTGIDTHFESQDYWDAVEKLHRCIEDLAVIQKGCSLAIEDVDRNRAELRRPKQPVFNQVAVSLARCVEIGLFSSDARLSNDGPLAQLFRFTCEAAGANPPDNVVYYLRTAFRPG